MKKTYYSTIMIQVIGLEAMSSVESKDKTKKGKKQ